MDLETIKSKVRGVKITAYDLDDEQDRARYERNKVTISHIEAAEHAKQEAKKAAKAAAKMRPGIFDVATLEAFRRRGLEIQRENKKRLKLAKKAAALRRDAAEFSQFAE